MSLPIVNTVSIDPGSGFAKVIQNAIFPLRFRFEAKTGMFSGDFRHTNEAKTKYRGILLNKGANRGGRGYFLSPPVSGKSEAGNVTIDPNGP